MQRRESETAATEAESRPSGVKYQQRLEAEREIAFERLLSSVSHALGTPLQVISGRASMVAADLANPAAAEHANIIIRKVKEVSQMLRELLELARSDRTPSEKVDVTTVVSDVVETIASASSPSGVKVTVETSESALLEARYDLVSVGLHALFNELVASYDGSGDMRVSVSDRAKDVCCTIRGLSRPFESSWLDSAHDVVGQIPSGADATTLLRRSVGFGVVRRLGGHCSPRTEDGKPVLDVILPKE